MPAPSDSAFSWQTFSIVIGIKPRFPRRVDGFLRRQRHVPPASPAPLPTRAPITHSGLSCSLCSRSLCSLCLEFPAFPVPHVGVPSLQNSNPMPCISLATAQVPCPPSAKQFSHRSRAQSLRPSRQLAAMYIEGIRKDGRLHARGVPHSVARDSTRVDPCQCRHRRLLTWRVTRATVAKQPITQGGNPCNSVGKDRYNSKVRQKRK